MRRNDRSKKVTIALAGQPNTGKSTVFNCLTGSNQHVGNWPGKTVEQKSGVFEYHDEMYTVVDLPGTYSLTANSLEEKIAMDFIIQDSPDVVVVVADASQMERSLYLLTEIQMLSVPVVVALNMMDVAEQMGNQIDIGKMGSLLGLPLVPLTASRRIGLDDLLKTIERTVSGKPEVSSFEQRLREDPLYHEIDTILGDIECEGLSLSWIISKTMEQDEHILSLVKQRISASRYSRLINILEQPQYGRLYMATLRYGWISGVLRESVSEGSDIRKVSRGKRFDRYATHPVWGKVIAVFMMISAFAVSMMIAMPLMGILQPLSMSLSRLVRDAFSSQVPWFGSMLSDGLIPGVTVSLMMLSFIIGVYFVFALLEDVGYIARLAFVFDTAMNKIGLHGKSSMPLFMSFGCNIAGVTATRVIDSWQQRMVTLVIVSIVPCLALWAVVSFMGAIFFSAAMPLLILSLIVVMVAHIYLTSYLLRRFIVPGETAGLIMELPPYHRPNWRTIFSYVWVQMKSFIRRAFTLISVLSLAVWALSYRSDGNMELSILASIGKFFDPVTSFLGLNWRLFIALLASIIAKEASLSVIAVLFGLGQGSSITSFIFSSTAVEKAELAGTIAQMVSPASALAFIFAFFFTIPCIGTVATIYSETKSLKWTIGSSLYYVCTSLIAGALAYRVGLLLF